MALPDLEFEKICFICLKIDTSVLKDFLNID